MPVNLQTPAYALRVLALALEANDVDQPWLIGRACCQSQGRR